MILVMGGRRKKDLVVAMALKNTVKAGDDRSHPHLNQAVLETREQNIDLGHSHADARETEFRITFPFGAFCALSWNRNGPHGHHDDIHFVPFGDVAVNHSTATIDLVIRVRR